MGMGIFLIFLCVRGEGRGLIFRMNLLVEKRLNTEFGEFGQVWLCRS